MTDEKTLEERIFEFNQQFDYGEYHDDPEFWLSMLGHQVREAWEAYMGGYESHAYREAADAVLVAFQFMRSCGDAAPHHYILERIKNAEDRGIPDEIVPKYIEWYEEDVLGGEDTYRYIVEAECPQCGELVEHGRSFDDPIPLDMEILLSPYCPQCGKEVPDWDVHEEHEVERVTPTQERVR